MIKFKKIASIICSLISIPSYFRASASSSISYDSDNSYNTDDDTYYFDDCDSVVGCDDEMLYHTSLTQQVNNFKDIVTEHPYTSAFIGILTLYELVQAYNTLDYVTKFVSYLKKCDWPENAKLSEYLRLVTNLTNKAYNSPHLENIIDEFIDSFNENTEINENNIVPATLTTSWYATLLKYSKLKDNTELSKKITKILQGIVKYLNLNANDNSFEIIGAGSEGIIIKVDDNYYKLCQGNCSDFIKNQKLTKLNNLLSDKNNKLIKIYQSNMIPRNNECANVLKLDYQKPTQIKTQNDLFNCIKDLCEGVKYLHESGYVYRDMKLDNTVITKNEEEKICLRIIDPDEIAEENSKMLNLRPSRTRLVDKLPFAKSTKSLDIYMVGNTIKELLDLYEKTEGVESLSSNSKKLIIEFIDDCHAFFNGKALSNIIGKIAKIQI